MNENMIELIIRDRQESHWDLYYYSILVLDEAGNVLTSHTTRDRHLFIFVPNHPNISTIEIVTKSRCSQESPPRILNITHSNNIVTTGKQITEDASGAEKNVIINIFSLAAITANIVTLVL